MPDEQGFDGLRTALQIIKGYDPKLTVLELGRLLLQSSDSWLVIGTAQEVADTLSEAFHAGAVDGYNLMFPFLPVDFDNFVDQVAPILKESGVMQRAYRPGTLREKLGLPPVGNQFKRG
ncbi:Pristinamycin IIA synthase subunit A [Cedecea neteri]|uniref:Pristinamycin IIA synthase subunit A n=1 Tax=Cedecea neteri TaxID=158822 RepID=A0A2X3IGQ8_9ENTR|nr:Pristinamycin IIA synthase subunit A [Cedecea neteri]